MWRRLRKGIVILFQTIKKWFDNSSRMKFVYAWYYKRAKIQQEQVLFESFHGKDLSDSPLYILQAFLKMPEAASYRIYFSTNCLKEHKKEAEALNLPVKLISIDSYRYAKALATSRYLVNNSSFPSYFIRREGQTYLQTWHGTPLKTLGRKMRFGIESMYNVQHNFLQANYVMFPNDYTRDVIMEDYNLRTLYTGNVVMNGYPRNSVFCDPGQGENVRSQLGNDDYTTIAYMPTWRGQSNHDIQIDSYMKDMDQLLAYLDENLKEHQKLYVNFHPILEKQIQSGTYKHIFPFPQGIDKYVFLNSVDALITDYSSVFFDFSITGKPIILFLYDYEQYQYDRGMYFDIRQLPFRKVFHREELKDCLVSEQFRYDRYDNAQEYRRRFLSYDAPDAAEKMAELLFHGTQGDLSVMDCSDNAKQLRHVFYPHAMSNSHKLDAVSALVNPQTDIVVFEKRYFNPDLSSYLYDHYPDAYDYIFITRSLPVTFMEEVCRAFNPSLRKMLHRREIRRCFGPLQIDPEFQKEYYHGGQNETFYYQKPAVQDVCLSVKNGVLCINFSQAKRNDFERLVIISRKRIILWARNLTREEKHTQTVTESFDGILRDQILNMSEPSWLALESWDASEETRCLYYLTDRQLLKNANAADDMNAADLYLPALFKKDITFRNNLTQPETAVLVYLKDKKVSFFVTMPDQIISRYVNIQVDKLICRHAEISITARMRKSRISIADVVLDYRSQVEDRSYALPYKVTEEGENRILTIQIRLPDLSLKELYWDLYVIVQQDKRQEKIKLSLSDTQLSRIVRLNKFCTVPDGQHIFYPYRSYSRKMLAFCYREQTEYDGNGARFREFIALAVYHLMRPYWNRRRIWLVYEKFCSMAQDNGYYFFQYCMEHLPERERKHIYYVLDQTSPDWEKMEQYGKQVIPFMSFRHILYDMAARLYIGSDAKLHLYVWRAKPNPVSARIEEQDIYFLQHGVTAMKRVDRLFGRQGSTPMTYFTTTSDYEQKIILDYFGYDAAHVPVVGFTRWDVLEDTSSRKERVILIMPTWRAWLDESSVEDFRNSDYFKRYQQLLSSAYFERLLKEGNARAVFYIHPKLREYLSEFNTNQERITLIPFGSTPLNQLIMQCSMLITDYSSVAWDVYYLGKPIIFYQFDYEMYMKVHGSYMDMRTQLFGDRYVDMQDMFYGISMYMRRDFAEKEKYAEMRKQYFAYQDHDNSKRTYQYIVDRGY